MSEPTDQEKIIDAAVAGLDGLDRRDIVAMLVKAETERAEARAVAQEWRVKGWGDPLGKHPFPWEKRATERGAGRLDLDDVPPALSGALHRIDGCWAIIESGLVHRDIKPSNADDRFRYIRELIEGGKWPNITRAERDGLACLLADRDRLAAEVKRQSDILACARVVTRADECEYAPCEDDECVYCRSVSRLDAHFDRDGAGS